LLIDPYARHIAGTVKWCDALFGYRVGNPREDLSIDRRDSAAAMPKCRVIDGAFSWAEDRPPRTPWHDTIIYELHVKGFTRNNRDIPPHLRGTYAGLATDPAIEHIKRLGVTAVELMPVHEFVDDRCSCSWTACATGCRRCTSTVSGLTWRRHWPGNCTRSTSSAPFSTSSTRTR